MSDEIIEPDMNDLATQELDGAAWLERRGLVLEQIEELIRDTLIARLRDAVIAGLRERGWPEPHPPLAGEVVWTTAPEANAFVRLAITGQDEVGWCYCSADGEWSEGGFHEPVSASRIIEAIDRLRWVIGPPPFSANSIPHGIFNPVGSADKRREADEAVGHVPLAPSKPVAPAARPYEPRKIGEF